jgi:hypothetical protein
MTNTIQLEKMVNQLNGLYQEETKQTVVNYLSDLFAEMGYGAISQEIRYNRQAKDNAIYGLKMYHSSLTGDLINPDTREVYKRPQDHIETVNKFCDMLKSVIETYLDNGTDKQREYLKLNGEYENAAYLFHEAMNNLNNFFDNATSRTENREEYKKIKEEYDKLDKLAKESKNKLDQFVLENLSL